MSVERDEFASRYGLSRKESQIFSLLVEGTATIKDLASTLNVSPETVRNQLKSILQKTGHRSKAELLCAYVKFVTERLQGFQALLRMPQVIVVDDEIALAVSISRHLEARGMRAYALSDPTHVADMVRTLPIDVVVSDLRMPRLSGLELLRELRAFHRFIPGFIMMSGNVNPEEQRKIIASGALAVIEKPLDLDDLQRRIKDFHVEDAKVRGRYVRVADASPVRFEGSIPARVENIGYGGLCVPVENSQQMAVLGQYDVGQIVRLAIEIQDRDRTIECSGQIVWRRLEEGPRGIGIQFVEMSPEDREDLLDYVRTRKVIGLIPPRAQI